MCTGQEGGPVHHETGHPCQTPLHHKPVQRGSLHGQHETPCMSDAGCQICPIGYTASRVIFSMVALWSI
ncbi:hypothetical protein Y1Q_0021215 [Alligator mississippiensis]|uniref:Uncharacterized protein n=1 Tax=Alligator mississippiensis TaxID=8496 RepID=A0A151MS94_ALLMI|nr:hypothetical protein Y1Q_0021215 [Alligator mississippiensis]